jgi:hypothetical protein
LWRGPARRRILEWSEATHEAERVLERPL